MNEHQWKTRREREWDKAENELVAKEMAGDFDPMARIHDLEDEVERLTINRARLGSALVDERRIRKAAEDKIKRLTAAIKLHVASQHILEDRAEMAEAGVALTFSDDDMLKKYLKLADELEANGEADRYKDATALANIVAKRIREIADGWW